MHKPKGGVGVSSSQPHDGLAVGIVRAHSAQHPAPRLGRPASPARRSRTTPSLLGWREPRRSRFAGVEDGGGFGLIMMVVVLCLAGTACSRDRERSQVQEDIPGRLETLAATIEHPVYFLGRSYEGTDLTDVGYDGSFIYGTCEIEPESGCAPPASVQTRPVSSFGPAVSGCERLPDIRGVPAASWGGGLVVFTADSIVQIFDNGIDGDLRSMAEALRPVSGPADVTKPLPAPTDTVLRAIAEACGAAP